MTKSITCRVDSALMCAEQPPLEQAGRGWISARLSDAEENSHHRNCDEATGQAKPDGRERPAEHVQGQGPAGSEPVAQPPRGHLKQGISKKEQAHGAAESLVVQV